MAKVAVEQLTTGDSVAHASYDSTKWTIGNLIKQTAAGGGLPAYMSPTYAITPARPVETSAAVGVGSVTAVQWDVANGIDWVFMADNSTASTTRRVLLYTYNRNTSAFSYQGFVTATPPGGTNHTVRSLRVTVDTYSTGTVSVTGTAVTGSSTAWQTARFAVGARIGFGSTDPTAISTWYEISAIGSDTSITLTSSAGSVAGGTSFVIEEIRLILVTTASTATNGGLNIVKGLNFSTFTGVGVTAAAATTTDNIRATYWLKDASTETNTVAAGCALLDKASNTSHDIYVMNGTTSLTWYRYNIRAALTLTSGADTANGFTYATAAQAVTGTASQLNNCRLATASHGSGSGVLSAYFTTTTRVYRIPISGLTTGATNWVGSGDSMVETPPGGTASMAVSNVMGSIEYASLIDRFIVSPSTNNGNIYVTQYQTSAQAFDHIMGISSGTQSQLDQSSQSSAMQPHFEGYSSGTTVWSEGGVCYLCRVGTAATLNTVYAVPLAAHWTYASLGGNIQRAISPVVSLSGATKLYRAYVNSQEVINTTGEHGMETMGFRVFYRTSGISDNSGSWNALAEGGSLSSVTASSIQLMFEWRTTGRSFLIPARIYGFTILYDAEPYLPAELEWNYADSSQTDGTMGFSQITTFGVFPTTFTINYYREDTDALVLTQASSGSTNGVFEFWNGSSWASGISTNTVGLRRRFRPTAGLPTGINLYAKITTA